MSTKVTESYTTKSESHDIFTLWGLPYRFGDRVFYFQLPQVHSYRISVTPDISAYRYSVADLGVLTKGVDWIKATKQKSYWGTEVLLEAISGFRVVKEELTPSLVVYRIPLQELDDSRFKLKGKIFITVERYPGEIICSWPLVNLYSSGTTFEEAVKKLQEEIVSLFEELQVEADEKLGRLPKEWKRILARFIESVNG